MNKKYFIVSSRKKYPYSLFIRFNAITHCFVKYFVKILFFMYNYVDFCNLVW